MVVGTCLVRLFIADSNSLKDKRRVVKSIIDHLRRRYNVSVAEVDDNDVWQTAALGVACVANESRFVNGVLDKVTQYLDTHPQVRLLGCELNVE